MSASNQIETIDAYLRGELTPGEVESFETQLDLDPGLAEEFAFQKSVFEGIRESRKLALKNRLSQIDVTGATVTGQVSALKILGGVILASVLGVAVYQFWPSETSPAIEEYGPYFVESDDVSVEFTLPEKELIEENLPTEVETPVKSETKKTITTPEPRENLASSSDTSGDEPIETDSEVTDFNPQVSLPDDDGDVAGKEFEPEELSENFSSTLETKDIDALNIERLDEKGKKLRYRYYDGKLALFGDFGQSPYQILEINQKDGEKQVFLLHNEKFYELEITKEEKPLTPIDDPTLLSELKIFQGRK